MWRKNRTAFSNSFDFLGTSNNHKFFLCTSVSQGVVTSPLVSSMATKCCLKLWPWYCFLHSKDQNQRPGWCKIHRIFHLHYQHGHCDCDRHWVYHRSLYRRFCCYFQHRLLHWNHNYSWSGDVASSEFKTIGGTVTGSELLAMQQTLVIRAILCIYYKRFFELWLYNSKFLSIIMKVVAFCFFHINFCCKHSV